MAADKAARRNGVTGARTARTSRPPPSRSPPSLDGVWHNVAVRGVIYQVLVLTALCGLAAVYVALFRNTPRLVQISFWYLLVTRLPPPRQAWNLAGIGFVSNRGLVIAVPAADPVWPWVGYAVLIAAVAAVLLARAAIA